jgi:hypothetical protein
MIMVSSIFWMFVQSIVGLWVFVSPFVLSHRMISATANIMIAGTSVVLVAMGVAFFNKNVCGCEPMEKRPTQRLEQKTN